MAQPWEAERHVDVALARRLLGEQVPALADAPIALVGEGWDNVVYRVGDAHVFRFPRRAVAAELVAHELAALPLLAEVLPVPVPRPVAVGKPSPLFPWPFTGYRWLEGTPASTQALADHARAALAAPVGRFLAALHRRSAGPLRARGLSGDTLGRLDPVRRIPLARQRLAWLQARGVGLPAERIRALLATWQADPPASLRAEVPVHGDFRPCHLLLDGAGALCGVIDWGDVHLGDPATDLMIVFAFLSPAARPALADAYGPIEPDTWRRARFRALGHMLALACAAVDQGARILAQEALGSLERVVDDD